MALVSPNQNELERLVKEADRILLDFSAPWCGPCKMIAPILEDVSREKPEWTVVKVDVDESPALAARFGVISIPMLVSLKNGEKTGVLVGLRSKEEILSLLKD